MKFIDINREGSPPHMRGKGQNQRGTGSGRGITPACAGKREFCFFDGCGHGDHPRVCGEKLPTVQQTEDIKGSPPRMRGKVINTNVPGHGLGITPACAGKRVIHYRVDRCGQDHPRVCGEKPEDFKLWAVGEGSPPRVRGKVGAPGIHEQACRITPACAGKRHPEDHLRTR